MKAFSTNEFINKIVAIINKNFNNELRVFVEKIETAIPEYLFIYTSGNFNNFRGLNNRTDGTFNKKAIHQFTLSMIYCNNNGSMRSLYDVHDKLCDIMMVQQELITRHAPLGINYEVGGDSKGVMLKIHAHFSVNDEFSAPYMDADELGMMEELELDIKIKGSDM